MIEAYNDMVGKLPLQFQLEAFNETYFGDYLCDTINDLADLPSDCETGSIARVITPPTVYMKASAGKWILQCSRKEDSENGL